MANFHFELVSPQKLLFSGDVEQVDVPGAEGEFGVLAEHAPMVTTLRPGILTVLWRRRRAEDRRARRFCGSLGGRPDGAGGRRRSGRGFRSRLRLQRVSANWKARSRRLEPGSELDKLITRLDHFKDVDRHLTGTAMH